MVMKITCLSNISSKQDKDIENKLKVGSKQFETESKKMFVSQDILLLQHDLSLTQKGLKKKMQWKLIQFFIHYFHIVSVSFVACSPGPLYDSQKLENGRKKLFVTKKRLKINCMIMFHLRLLHQIYSETKVWRNAKYRFWSRKVVKDLFSESFRTASPKSASFSALF